MSNSGAVYTQAPVACRRERSMRQIVQTFEMVTTYRSQAKVTGAVLPAFEPVVEYGLS